MTWIQTYHGRRFDLSNPTPSMVFFDDIAHALSRVGRYTGHCREFYSVAQHSVIVASILPDHLKMQGLLHDATEAYVGDMSRPLKQMLPEYQEIERRVWYAIAARFGLPAKLDPLVKRADNLVLMAERRELLNRPPEPWAPELEALVDEARAIPVSSMSPSQAWMEFRRAFGELSEGCSV